MIDEFEVQAIDTILAESPAAYYRDNAQTVALAFDTQECSGFDIERRKDCSPTEADVLRNTDLARLYISILIELFQ